MKFNAEKTTNEIIKFIQGYFASNHLKGAVIGVSGGKDSAVVAALFAKALGSKNVVGVYLPCSSRESDKKDAKLLCNTLEIELREFDLNDIYSLFVTNIKKNNRVYDDYLIDANINIKPRLRMMTLYYYAALLSKEKKGIYIVAGTSNKCEKFVGYFTKGGDNVCDISILGNLTVSEVIIIGDYLKLPQHIIHKTPDDGLSNLTDEEKLGVTYKDIEKYLNGEKIDENIQKIIEKHHKNNAHKFTIPTFGGDK